MKMKRREILWNRGKQTFSVKGKTINILGFAGPILSVATTYSHHCSIKKKSHRQFADVCKAVLIKLYLQLQVAGYIWPLE